MDREPDVVDVAQAFSSVMGKRALKWMRNTFHIDHTLQPEQVWNAENPGERPIPIDPTGVLIREGMRVAYNKILVAIEVGEDAMRRKAEELIEP